MSDIDKQISTLLGRFDNLVYTDFERKDEGDEAFEKLVDFLNYYPQNINILEKLFPALTKACPSGTKRTLKLTLISKTLYDAVTVGNDQYLDIEVLVIDLTLPESETEYDTSSLSALVEKFAKTQGDFGGVFLVQFN